MQKQFWNKNVLCISRAADALKINEISMKMGSISAQRHFLTNNAIFSKKWFLRSKCGNDLKITFFAPTWRVFRRISKMGWPNYFLSRGAPFLNSEGGQGGVCVCVCACVRVSFSVIVFFQGCSRRSGEVRGGSWRSLRVPTAWIIIIFC